MKAFLMISLTAVFLMNAGCAKENKNLAQVPADSDNGCRGCYSPSPVQGGSPLPPAPGGSGGLPDSGFDDGATASLQLNGGNSTLAELFYQSMPNNPTNIRINIDLRRTTNAVIVRYTDNGQYREAHFGTVHPYSGIQNAKYNGWVNQNGKSVWKGFFQDRWGAVVIVIDRLLSQGDGQPGQFVGGSIWFQNFNQYWPNNPYQGSEKMCWEISRGPYDCRTFLVSGNVQMVSSLYPNNRGPDRNVSYKKLGNFDGLSAAAAGF